jgi:hypothetical protein
MPTCIDCNGYFDSVKAADDHICIPATDKPVVVRSAFQDSQDHYKFLDEHFDTILTRMGKTAIISRRGDFATAGDKYYSYRERWEAAGIPWFHGAAMYHLLELLYSHEARNTATGWVFPHQWVIDNYEKGHNLSQYMKDLISYGVY